MNQSANAHFDEFDEADAIDFLKRRAQAIQIAEQKLSELSADTNSYDLTPLAEQAKHIKQALDEEALLNACLHFRDLAGWVRVEAGANKGNGYSPLNQVGAVFVGIIVGGLSIGLATLLATRLNDNAGTLSWLCQL